MSSAVETQIHKPAKTDYPVMDLIKKRWSPLAFDNRLIEKEKLLTILEASRWAPSARNTQPWRFIVATRDKPTQFEKMLSILKERNQTWAKDAPALILAITKEDHDNGMNNRHAEHDTGQALAYLTLQALEFDIYLRMIGGFYPDKAQERYKIPTGYKAMTAIALGYLGKLEQLDEINREKEQGPRHRMGLNELVFSGDWGNRADILE